MVCASVRQREEEDLSRPGPDHFGQETQDVQFSGVEGPQDCLQEVKGQKTHTHTQGRHLF